MVLLICYVVSQALPLLSSLSTTCSSLVTRALDLHSATVRFEMVLLNVVSALFTHGYAEPSLGFVP